MKKIRIMLIILTSLACAFSAGSLISYQIRVQREMESYYKIQNEALELGKPVFSGVYCFPDRHPNILIAVLATLLISTLTLVATRREYLWLLSSFAALGMFVYWFVDTQKAWAVNETQPRPYALDGFLYRASALDVTVLGLLSAAILLEIVALASSFRNDRLL